MGRTLYWVLSLSVLSILTIIGLSTYLFFSPYLTSASELTSLNDVGVILMDRNGVPFFNFYQAKQKIYTPISQIPKTAQQALIASEDQGFYTHPGFSLKAITRSLKDNIETGSSYYGGSTITQQLIKSTLLNPNKNLIRKYQEIILAQRLEQIYGKDQILEMYLNTVYFGEGAFGIGQAAKVYYDKKPEDLSLAQSSMLIGLLPAPSRYSPLSGNINQAKLRQEEVLNRMVKEGYISEEEKDKALKEEITFNQQGNTLNKEGAHFALMVIDQLVNMYGADAVQNSGFKVTTTLDLNKQQEAEVIVQKNLIALAPNQARNGAAVAMDPKTGEVLALVGSKSWYDDSFGKVNMASTPRQVGSSFKPIVYSAAFEKHLITPSTMLRDSPTTFERNYKPKDYDGRYRGMVTARRALANSLNIPAVEVISKLGVINAIENARNLGITTLEDPSQYGLSLVLGAGEVPLIELTNAYGVFADNGQYKKPVLILSINDKYNQNIYKYELSKRQAISPETSFLITSILSDQRTRAEVFGNTLNISRPAAVKTGTTEDYKDALTVGYTPSLVVGVWVGNNDNKPMDRVAGSLGAAPIWKDIMENYLKGTPVEKWD